MNENSLFIESLTFHPDSTFTYLRFSKNDSAKDLAGFSRGFWDLKSKGHYDLISTRALMGYRAISTGYTDFTGVELKVKLNGRIVLSSDSIYMEKSMIIPKTRIGLPEVDLTE